MAEITLRGLAHRYAQGDDYALRNIDLTWRDGGAYALLGPSGCGKSTMLNIISGLVAPSEGTVCFDSVDVTNVSTAERNIAQVFQFPVLYESMTVEQNLRFPLRNRRVPKAVAQRRAVEIAELLGIAHLLKVKSKGLSADAKQLVALGRALVRTDVSAILFDEPLTVIDPQKKWELRQALKRVHAELSHTLIYVTHDQTEALTFADEVVVMTEGEVVQQASPDVLFEYPTHRFVGNFIGIPGMNFLRGVVADGRVSLAGTDLLELPTATGDDDNTASSSDEGAFDELGVRPEFVDCHPAAVAGAVPATVTAVRDIGRAVVVELAVDGQPLVAKVPAGGHVPAGNTWVTFAPGMLHLFRRGRVVAGVGVVRQ